MGPDVGANSQYTYEYLEVGGYLTGLGLLGEKPTTKREGPTPQISSAFHSLPTGLYALSLVCQTLVRFA